MTEVFELPVEWFDSPEPGEMFTNNDLEPTEADHPEDYRGPSRWIKYHPHPDMEGNVCSSGFVHEYRCWQLPPVAPVGIASVPVRRHWESACYD